MINDLSLVQKTRDVECSNCGVKKSSEWRRNPYGQPVCNACGLYFKLHSKNRPIHMRRDFIAHRKRTTTCNAIVSSDDNSETTTVSQSVINATNNSISDQTDSNKTVVGSETPISVSSAKKRKQSNPKKLVIADNYI